MVHSSALIALILFCSSRWVNLIGLIDWDSAGLPEELDSSLPATSSLSRDSSLLNTSSILLSSMLVLGFWNVVMAAAAELPWALLATDGILGLTLTPVDIIPSGV